MVNRPSVKRRSPKRDVMRQSPGPTVLKNGCVVVSSRPRRKSKPTAAATASPKARWRSPGHDRRRTAAPVRDGVSQRHQLAPQRVEQAGQVVAARVRLVAVEERVVRVGGQAERLGLALLEADDRLQPRAEAGELGGTAGVR